MTASKDLARASARNQFGVLPRWRSRGTNPVKRIDVKERPAKEGEPVGIGTDTEPQPFLLEPEVFEFPAAAAPTTNIAANPNARTASRVCHIVLVAEQNCRVRQDQAGRVWTGRDQRRNIHAFRPPIQVIGLDVKITNRQELIIGPVFIVEYFVRFEKHRRVRSEPVDNIEVGQSASGGGRRRKSKR